MKCLNEDCKALLEDDDYFCYECGKPTTKGLSYLSKKENVNKILGGNVVKQDNRFKIIILLNIILFSLFIIIQGNNLFKPIFYLNRIYNSYINGYKTSIIKTNNIYNKINVNSFEEATTLIKKDFSNQTWKCIYNYEILAIQEQLENDYNIISVNFCDIELSEVENIQKVIKEFFEIFPNTKGALTNITITNAKEKSDYIAYFQPKYQFVNPSLDISNYNKVNKTQILLNSYYFLNSSYLNKPLDMITNNNLYVKDSTINSIIAHELGHYVTFYLYLKQNNIQNIIYETKDNYQMINKLIDEFDNGNYTEIIVNKAYNNYLLNNNYITIDEFINNISTYAAFKDKNNDYNTKEIIAEAVHDYYLHKNNASKSSLEIIKIIKNSL